MNWSPLRSVLFDEFPAWNSQWRGLADLEKTVNQLITRNTGGQGIAPSTNVYTDGDKITVTAEIPGVKADNLDVSVVGRRLTISGKRENESVKEGERYLHKEIVTGEFSRILNLPFMIDNETIEATHKDGVLTIRMQRAEADKPKKIAIK